MIHFARFTRFAVLALSAVATAGHAQDYPVRPIRVIAPFPAGTGPDVDTRSVTAELSRVLKQTVVVENRPGAANRIGMEAGAKATPDGYTLVVATPTALCIVPHVYKSVPYNVERDFAPVSLMGLVRVGLLATAGLPASNVKDVVAQLKSKPGSLMAGNVGVGSGNHLAALLFENRSGAKFHHVPYSASAPFADLVGGQIHLMFDALPASYGNIAAGRLKLLALTGSSRHAAYPNVQTFAESGVTDFNPVFGIGLLAPAGTPHANVEKLSAAVKQAIAQSQPLIDKWHSYAGEIKGTTPAEFQAFIKAESAKWLEVVRQSNIKLD